MIEKYSRVMQIVLSLLMVSAGMLAVSCDDKSENDQVKQLLPFLLLRDDGTTRLILYNAGTHDGNLGGRGGADDICRASANTPLGAKNIHAFISTSTADEIRDMPSKYGYPTDFAIYGPDGTSLIANNWADMVDDSINMSISAAGVMPGANHWISGSDSDGSYDVTNYNNCIGFTNNENSNTFQLGYSNETDENWLNAMGDTCDVDSYYLLCVCKQ